MNFHDAHAHRVCNQNGGLIIGLEGDPVFDNTVTNSQAFALQDAKRNLWAVEYVTRGSRVGTRPLLKYHPRREGYSADFVRDSIKDSKPKLCIVDTLNQPQWQPLQYWNIACAFPEIQFVFCHAGGYDILEFLKMADFAPNIWIDFSLTQEFFGWVGSRARFPHVSESIDYAMCSDRLKAKVLFGSDEPFFSQAVALEKYLSHRNRKLFCETNFVTLLRKAQLI